MPLTGAQTEEIGWYSPSGQFMSDADWADPRARSVGDCTWTARTLRPRRPGDSARGRRDLLLLVNGWYRRGRSSPPRRTPGASWTSRAGLVPPTENRWTGRSAAWAMAIRRPAGRCSSDESARPVERPSPQVSNSDLASPIFETRVSPGGRTAILFTCRPPAPPRRVVTSWLSRAPAVRGASELSAPSPLGRAFDARPVSDDGLAGPAITPSPRRKPSWRSPSSSLLESEPRRRARPGPCLARCRRCRARRLNAVDRPIASGRT